MTINDSTLSGPPTSSGSGPHGIGSNADLRGRLGTASLVLTVIAYNGPIIILSGLVAPIIASGNGLAAPTTFLTLGLLVAVFAVGINAMASRMTHAGAFYTYITAGLGRVPGLAAGFVAILAYLILGAGITVMFGVSVHTLFYTVFGVHNGPSWQFWSLIAWAAVATLSMFNIEMSAKVLGTLSCAEIIVVLVWNARVYINGGPEGRVINVFSSYFSGSLAFALVIGIVCLTGFESLQVFRAETKDSLKTVPRATYISVALMAGLYTVSSYAYLVAFGPSKAVEVATSNPSGSFLDSVAFYVARPVADIANVLLTTSSFAAALAVQTILSRYLYSLGRDRVLPRVLGNPNAKYGSPMNAAITAALGGLALLALPVLGIINPDNAFVAMTGAGTFCLVLLYFATSIAIFWFFARRDERVSKLQSVVAPLTSALGMGAIAYLSTVRLPDVIGQSQTIANWCLVVIAATIGLGVITALWFRAKRPGTYETIGRQSTTITPEQ